MKAWITQMNPSSLAAIASNAMELQGGLLDKISVSTFGIIMTILLGAFILVDSEWSWLSDDEPDHECRCQEPRSQSVDTQQISDQPIVPFAGTEPVDKGSRSRRRLRYRSRTLTRLKWRSDSGPDRGVSLRRRSCRPASRCEDCAGLQKDERVRAADADSKP